MGGQPPSPHHDGSSSRRMASRHRTTGTGHVTTTLSPWDQVLFGSGPRASSNGTDAGSGGIASPSTPRPAVANPNSSPSRPATATGRPSTSTLGATATSILRSTTSTRQRTITTASGATIHLPSGPSPPSRPPTLILPSDSDPDGSMPVLSPGPLTRAPLATEVTESIEPAAPGCRIGLPLNDDTLDTILTPPPLEKDTDLAEYGAAAERWLMTDACLEQYEEFYARGLVMVRNLVRAHPGPAVHSSPWLATALEGLKSKFGLIRAASANLLAAYAASMPGRDAVQRDPLALQRVVELLKAGIAAGCDNHDTQYACLALANIALNGPNKGHLVSLGVVRHATEVLRAAGKWVASVAAAGGAAAAGHAAAHGRRPGPVARAAAHAATLLACLAVDTSGRAQLQLHGSFDLVYELHGRCAGALGPDALLSRRLALVVAAGGAAAIMEDPEAAAATGMLSVGWDDELDDGGPPGASHRGLRTFTQVARATAAMCGLQRLVGHGHGLAQGGHGHRGSGNGHGSAPDRERDRERESRRGTGLGEDLGGGGGGAGGGGAGRLPGSPSMARTPSRRGLSLAVPTPRASGSRRPSLSGVGPASGSPPQPQPLSSLSSPQTAFCMPSQPQLNLFLQLNQPLSPRPQTASSQSHPGDWNAAGTPTGRPPGSAVSANGAAPVPTLRPTASGMLGVHFSMAAFQEAARTSSRAGLEEEGDGALSRRSVADGNKLGRLPSVAFGTSYQRISGAQVPQNLPSPPPGQPDGGSPLSTARRRAGFLASPPSPGSQPAPYLHSPMSSSQPLHLQAAQIAAQQQQQQQQHQMAAVEAEQAGGGGRGGALTPTRPRSGMSLGSPQGGNGSGLAGALQRRDSVADLQKRLTNNRAGMFSDMATLSAGGGGFQGPSSLPAGGGGGRSACSSPMAPRAGHAHVHSHGPPSPGPGGSSRLQLDLPFHLVRAQPEALTAQAAAGRLSRTQAQYGAYSPSRAGNHGISRMYTSEL